MTKRVCILALCFLASAAAEGEAAVALFPGTVLDVDDQDAGQLIIAGKARPAAKDERIKNTAKEHEDAIDVRAKAAAVDPQRVMAEAMATAMAKTMAAEFAKLKATEPAKA